MVSFPSVSIGARAVARCLAAYPTGAATKPGVICADRGNSSQQKGRKDGPHRVYLTLAGAPYVVSIAKPHL
jgi:hypothetical protein